MGKIRQAFSKLQKKVDDAVERGHRGTYTTGFNPQRGLWDHEIQQPPQLKTPLATGAPLIVREGSPVKPLAQSGWTPEMKYTVPKSNFKAPPATSGWTTEEKPAVAESQSKEALAVTEWPTWPIEMTPVMAESKSKEMSTTTRGTAGNEAVVTRSKPEGKPAMKQDTRKTKAELSKATAANNPQEKLVETVIPDVDPIQAFLRDHTINISATNFNLAACLSLACHWNRREVARWLLSQDDSILTSERKESALLRAVEIGSSDVVGLLLAHGVNINAKSPIEHFTALHIAMTQQDLAILRLLLKRGADVHAKILSSGDTPLHAAVRRERHDLVLLLLKAGANPRVKNKAGTGSYQLAGDLGLDKIFKIFHDWVEPTAPIRKQYLDSWGNPMQKYQACPTDLDKSPGSSSRGHAGYYSSIGPEMSSNEFTPFPYDNTTPYLDPATPYGWATDRESQLLAERMDPERQRARVKVKDMKRNPR